MAYTFNFWKYKDRIRTNMNSYTRQAFALLPTLHDPIILDIGCGTGVPTVELARMSSGSVVALDKDRLLLDILESKINGTGLAGRITPVQKKIEEMDFPRESFDLIWAEGSIYTVGFKKGLEKWGIFLKKGGYMVIHDDSRESDEKLAAIRGNGFDLMNHLFVSGEEWWLNFYLPLEKVVEQLRNQFINVNEIMSVLEMEQKEIDTIRQNPDDHGSVFFIMQKKNF